MSPQSQLQALLALRASPVAISFRPQAPAGLPRVGTGAAAGCGYWKRAADGEAFYTEAPDHYGCPVGAYTHGIALPEETAKELQGLVEVMVGLEYLRMEEVPTLPRLAGEFGVAIYSPLALAEETPDVVLVRGTARQIMLLAEAAQAAGVRSGSPAMGRPACGVLPGTLLSGQATASLGCIGNRVYTELPDDELYYAIPGNKLEEVERRLATIVNANRELEAFHRSRAST
jgi:uncharacterized protein (DUF169 family)